MRLGARVENVRTAYLQCKDAYLGFELARLQARDIVNSAKPGDEEKKRRLVKQFYEMMCFVLVLPFNTKKLHLAGIEMLGDLLMEYHDFRAALIYYQHGVRV